MQIRVGDSVYRASQLEKCWKAMQENDRVASIYIVCHSQGFGAGGCAAHGTFHGDDADSPFSALASCIRSNADQFREWGIERCRTMKITDPFGVELEVPEGCPQFATDENAKPLFVFPDYYFNCQEGSDEYIQLSDAHHPRLWPIIAMTAAGWFAMQAREQVDSNAADFTPEGYRLRDYFLAWSRSAHRAWTEVKP